MGLVLYNTLTKSKEKFRPIEEGKVRMYVCGPTVYDLLHIGNFRGPIFFNLVRNWLESEGYEVNYVYNYTDVDDKIIKRAMEENVPATTISERYIEEFEKDFKRLGLRSHSHNPKVTMYMPQIISFIEDLITKEMAYIVDGEVFYNISKFNDYGKLSGKKLDELNAGERVEVDERKLNPHDFVLWKPSKEGEPFWASPWGNGRPGWHIECSAMIKSLLGESIDIHGGGIDLIFPHHENEIAQGEGRSHENYCNCWMHNDFIIFKDEKMSKSLGNVITCRNFMDTYHPEILKFAMLSSHYRSVMNFNDDRIKSTIAGLLRIYSALRDAEDVVLKTEDKGGSPHKELVKIVDSARNKIKKFLNDDFNTGEVIAQIFEVTRTFNGLNLGKKLKDINSRQSAQLFVDWMKKQGALMALFQESPVTFLERLDEILLKENKIDIKEVEKLVSLRDQARADKDWALSDQYRDKLHTMGIEVHDGDGIKKWSVKI